MPQAGHLMVVLLLAVPLQYFICEWTTPSAVERVKLIKQISKSLTLFTGGVLEWKNWQDLILNWTQSWLGTSEGDEGECPAVEVINYLEKNGYFGMSTEPRTTRPNHVKFQVGQIIRHKLWNYRGVIIGWDETRKASKSWARQNHGDQEHWQNVPNYAILVDIRDRPSSQITYVPEEHIEIISNTKIVHVLVEEYFAGFDGARYLPRPWLRKVYPHG